VYVTDGEGGGAFLSLANDTLVVTAEHHERLFGSALAWLRAPATESSATREDSKNVVDLGNSCEEKSKKCFILYVRSSVFTIDHKCIIYCNVKYVNTQYLSLFYRSSKISNDERMIWKL
jgi:hypothetical protein